MFDGREFCVVNGPRDFPKEEMERKIAEVPILQPRTQAFPHGCEKSCEGRPGYEATYIMKTEK